jgi:hypothetical protein
MHSAPQPLKVVAVGRPLKAVPPKGPFSGPPPHAPNNRSPPHVDTLRHARQMDTPSTEDSTDETTRTEGDECECEEADVDHPTAGLSPPSSTSRPDRPVPLPPGKTADDFWFLFGTPQATQLATPVARLAAAKENQTRRMSVMNIQPLLHLPSPAAKKPEAVPAIVAVAVTPSPRNVSPRDKTPRPSVDGLLSPRSERKTGFYKTERLMDVLCRIADAEHEWTTLLAAPDVVMAEIAELVAGRAVWEKVDQLEQQPSYLLRLAEAFLASFPRDVLLTSVLRDFFVGAAAVEDERRRRLSFFALYNALPQQHEELLRALLVGLGRLNDGQLAQAAILFGGAMGGKEVVRRLVRDFPVICSGSLGGEIVFDVRTHLLVAASARAVVDVLLDPHYELLEPQFLDLVVLTSRCFMTDAELISILTERYLELLARERKAEVLLARESLLMFVHQLLLSRHSGKFTGDFAHAISMLQAALSEEGDNAAVHVSFLKSFDPDAIPSRPAIHGPITPPGIVPTALSLSAAEWTAALTLAATDIFKSVQPEDVICRNWEQSAPFRQMREFFNGLQLFVATAVLVPEDRATMLITLEHWVQVASGLVAVRNFHAAFAVFAGLSMPCIARLKGLWETIPLKISVLMDELHALFDPSRNHLSYQKALDASPENECVVPNMVLLLKWLFTIEEVNPTLLSSGNVNVEKLRMLYVLSQKIAVYQDRPSFVGSASPEALAFCRCIPSVAYQSEAALFDLSLARMPRGEVGNSKLSLRTQVTAAMIRARTSTEQRRKTSLPPPEPSSMSSSLRTSGRPSSVSGPGGVERNAMSRHSDGSLRSSAPARTTPTSRSEMTVESPNTVQKRGMVCPVCLTPFLDKSDLLLHISQSTCSSDDAKKH